MAIWTWARGIGLFRFQGVARVRTGLATAFLAPGLLGCAVCFADADKSSASTYFSSINAPCANDKEKKCETNFRMKLEKLKECSTIDKECKPGEDILQEIFGSTYRAVLPDYLVYLDQRAGLGRFKKQAPVLMWKGTNTPYLEGVRNIYVIVFTEHKTCLNASVTTDFLNEPNPFADIFKTLNSNVTATTAAALESETKEGRFAWYPLNGDPATTGLWFAMSRHSVKTNTTNRVTIRYVEPADQAHKDPKDVPPECKLQTPKTPADTRNAAPSGVSDKPINSSDLNAVNGFFSNSPGNNVGFSLALGMTNNTRDTKLGDGTDEVSINGYALVKYYVKRPRLGTGIDGDYQRPSWAVFGGTNLRNSAFDEIVLGLSYGHVFGNVGFVAGVNSISARKDVDHSGRKSRFFFGTDYTF